MVTSFLETVAFFAAGFLGLFLLFGIWVSFGWCEERFPRATAVVTITFFFAAFLTTATLAHHTMKTSDNPPNPTKGEE